MTAGRAEEGFSLVELMMACVLMIVILGATLTTFERFTSTEEATQQRNDSQDRVRFTTDRLAHELRNLASPTPEQPQAVDKAGAYDLVFQTVDPVGPNAGSNTRNVRRVRYCLDASNPSSALLVEQVQRWTTTIAPQAPATASCPDSAWPANSSWGGRTSHPLADHITNRIGGQDRAMFAFDSATPTTITAVRSTLFLDADTVAAPKETELRTGVFLRNQNRVPVADFTATPTNNRHVLLNASASEDPEGQALTYAWYDVTANNLQIPTCSGVVCDYQAPVSGSRQFKLSVLDPAGLRGDLVGPPVTVLP